MQTSNSLNSILSEVSQCRLCAGKLSHEPRPVVRLHPKNRILIVGQAPSSKVHQSGIPWDDQSGDRLRDWLGIDREAFYHSGIFGLLPMGFCYPGKGKTGDLPPRPECKPKWHSLLLPHVPGVELVLLVGQYAQNGYLGESAKASLTDTVRNWRDYSPLYFPLPHPSPRNGIWLARNPWFMDDVVDDLRCRVNILRT